MLPCESIFRPLSSLRLRAQCLLLLSPNYSFLFLPLLQLAEETSLRGTAVKLRIQTPEGF
jgi:hypothetical protein